MLIAKARGWQRFADVSLEDLVTKDSMEAWSDLSTLGADAERHRYGISSTPELVSPM